MATSVTTDQVPLLEFSAPVPETIDTAQIGAAKTLAAARAAEPAFGEEPDLPPTWSENSRTFHTTEKCTRLQAIRRNRRITGNPGLRDHCLNCLDIVSTKRRG